MALSLIFYLFVLVLKFHMDIEAYLLHINPEIEQEMCQSK